jgi:hypothetical protein
LGVQHVTIVAAVRGVGGGHQGVAPSGNGEKPTCSAGVVSLGTGGLDRDGPSCLSFCQPSTSGGKWWPFPLGRRQGGGDSQPMRPVGSRGARSGPQGSDLDMLGHDLG